MNNNKMGKLVDDLVNLRTLVESYEEGLTRATSDKERDEIEKARWKAQKKADDLQAYLVKKTGTTWQEGYTQKMDAYHKYNPIPEDNPFEL